MKAALLLAVFVVAALAAPFAFAQDAFDLRIQQRNPESNGDRQVWIPLQATDCFLRMNAATTFPDCAVPAVSPVDWADILNRPLLFPPAAHTHPISDVIGLQPALDGKFGTPTGTAAQYVRGDGVLATLPVATPPTQAAATRALNTAFQVSASRPAFVIYSVQITVTASIAGGQVGDVVLEIASDAAFTTAVQTVAISGLGQTYSLAIALQGVQPQTGVVVGFVPAGFYARLRSVSTTGAPAFSVRAGQEVLL